MKYVLATIAAVLAAVSVYAGCTNYFVVLPIGTAATNAVVWQFSDYTNTMNGTSNGGGITKLQVYITGAALYSYNAPASNGVSPTVPTGFFDNNGTLTYRTPGLTNITAREAGTTGNVTAEVWSCWGSIPTSF